MIYLFRYTFTSKIPTWTETFIYYELHKLGVRGPSWGTLPHKRIFFFPVFLFLSIMIIVLIINLYIYLYIYLYISYELEIHVLYCTSCKNSVMIIV